jgi:hypothetical protein
MVNALKASRSVVVLCIVALTTPQCGRGRQDPRPGEAAKRPNYCNELFGYEGVSVDSIENRLIEARVFLNAIREQGIALTGAGLDESTGRFRPGSIERVSGEGGVSDSLRGRIIVEFGEYEHLTRLLRCVRCPDDSHKGPAFVRELQVVDSTGAPVPGARLTGRRMSDGKPFVETVSGSDGRISLKSSELAHWFDTAGDSVVLAVSTPGCRDEIRAHIRTGKPCQLLLSAGRTKFVVDSRDVDSTASKVSEN